MARIDQVQWMSNPTQTSLQVILQPYLSRQVEATALTHHVSAYAKGTHLKVTFEDTLLAHPIAKIAPRGIVKAAFVTQTYVGGSAGSHIQANWGGASQGGRANLDLFLTRPGKAWVENQNGMAIVHVMESGTTTAVSPTVGSVAPTSAGSNQPGQGSHQGNYQGNQLASGQMQPRSSASFFDSDSGQVFVQAKAGRGGLAGLAMVTPTLLNDGSGAIDLLFNGAIPDLTHFMMSDPPRVVIDMANTPNRSGKVDFDLGIGLFTTAQVVSSEHRLRLILDLKRSVQFEAEAIDAGYRLKAYAPSPVEAISLKTYSTGQSSSNQPSLPLQTNSGPSTSQSKPVGKVATIAGIDFRRTSAGQGRVIVKLNNPKTVVNFDKRGGELVASFVNATLGAENEKRLDVVDFATPVETVDLIRKGANVELVISSKGQFKHSVTQTESEYIVDVSPLSKRELLALEESKTGYKGETLSLNFQKIPVRAALQVIADFTGLNIITSDSVKGDLSLRLNDVPWDQALDLILQTKNLSMRQKGNVIRVAPAAELAAQEKRAFEAQQEVGQLEPLITDLVRVNYAKAEEVAALLKSVKAVDTGIKQSAFGSVSVNELKTEENSLLSARGSVTVDKRTNTLLLQDTVSRIRELRKLIGKLDVPVKQIQIETRIVEATDDFSRSLGARLGFLRITDNAQIPGSSDNNSLGTIFGSGNIENNNSVRVDNEILYPDDLSINLPADPLNGNSPASYAYQIVKIGAGYLNLLDLELSALQAEGKGKIIANPKITTTDKHEAKIEQGQERVFSSSSLLQGGVTTKKAVLGLVVTPQVTPDNQIILDVKITNDSFAAADTLNTKNIQTQTVLRNGETIVIGGIYQQAQADTVTKTPILGDIPVLGNLFKKRTKRDNRTELLIFLTPRILNPDFG